MSEPSHGPNPAQESEQVDAHPLAGRVAVAGAAAYDQIGHTGDLLHPAGDPVLNYKLTDIRQHFGGCGANLAYNLALTGTPCTLVAATGSEDDSDLLAHWQRHHIDTRGILRLPGRSARALIITDPAGDQLTGFYPGPEITPDQWSRHLAELDLADWVCLVQAPMPATLMQSTLTHARTLSSPPYAVWNPGQYTDRLGAQAVADMAPLWDCLIGNSHEINYLYGISRSLSGKLVVQTRGSEPVLIRAPDGTCTEIPVPEGDAVDPTGCGDAFIAGWVACLVGRSLAHHGAPLGPQDSQQAAAEGIALAQRCLAVPGAQSHQL